MTRSAVFRTIHRYFGRSGGSRYVCQIGIFAALAEFEVELIRERTRAGLAAARARGRVGGRPRKMTETTLKMAMTAMADPKSQPKEVAKRLGITTTTLYDYVNGDGSLKATGQQLLNKTRDRTAA